MRSYEGEHHIIHMMHVAQAAREHQLVVVLRTNHRQLLVAPSGVSPGDKDWPEFLKTYSKNLGTVKTEDDIPQYVNKALKFICRAKTCWLLVNYIGMEAYK